jgi:threonyl-tRNA synthetase
MEGEIPAYIKDRLALYEKFKAEYDAEIANIIIMINK